VVRYARPTDYALGAVAAAGLPGTLYLWERLSPSLAGKGAMPPMLRLATGLGIGAGFMFYYSRSYGMFDLDSPALQHIGQQN
jgi:NADH-ubiquinone oxidoreductase complex I, 21 kDa subunit